MTRDFTMAAYGELVEAGLDGEFEFLTVRDYLTSPARPERFVVLRHDVDRDPENARAMAELEAELGVQSTYYFRSVPETFQPDLISWIADLGHEIGYHYEDLDRAGGDVRLGHKWFAANLARFRELCQIDTVCMHGNPLTAHDNRDLWRGPDATGFEAYDLLGEAYLSMDFTDVTYFSDTGRTWRDGELKIKDHPVGDAEKTIQVSTTAELAALLRERRLPRVCILAHPERWARNLPELVTGQVRDSTVNTGKRLINILS